ncbi:MAG: hypothetical protein R8F63_00645 [Acidimicrobiales bacterium]|nr:hypothetical protein [Acidimicrobiales bacterium]
MGDEISVTAVSDELGERPDGSLDAQSVGPIASLRLEVEIDTARLAECLSPGESVRDACSVVLLARSIASRRRDCIERCPVEETTVFDLDLPRARHRGLVELTVRVVRSVDVAEPEPGRAFEIGELLGEADPVRVHFDEPQTAPGASLEVEWRDFASDPKLQDQREHIFALDDAEPPVILLNSGIRMLYEILSNKGPRGRPAKIRDAVFMQIVHQVWTSLLGDAAAAALEAKAELERSGQPPDATAVLDEVGGWRAVVLRDWAPSLTGESDPEQAVDRVVDDLADGLGLLLVNAVPRAIQERLGTRKSYDGLVKEMRLIGD